jgi:hypothetical protein
MIIFTNFFRSFSPDVVHFWSARNQQKTKQIITGTVGDQRSSGAGVQGALVFWCSGTRMGSDGF